MITYFLGREQISGYLRDFLSRLKQLDPTPTLWCPLTRSGTALLRELIGLLKAYPKLASRVSVLPIGVGEASKIRFIGGTPAKDIPGKTVLIFDGATHSGQLMRQCVQEVLRYGAANVCTYSLVLKRGSKFIPTLWGLTVDDVDRAFFLLKEIPNNRLDAGPPKDEGKKCLNLHLRVLCESDQRMPLVISGLASLDRVTWGDRHFDMEAGHNRCTYLLEQGDKILGYLTLSHSKSGWLTVDEVAVDKKHHGKNLGAVMIRFADTSARHFDCRQIRLYAISDRREFYKKFGYKLIAEAPPLKLNHEEYWLMQKAVIYNQSVLSQ